MLSSYRHLLIDHCSIDYQMEDSLNIFMYEYTMSRIDFNIVQSRLHDEMRLHFFFVETLDFTSIFVNYEIDFIRLVEWYYQ